MHAAPVTALVALLTIAGVALMPAPATAADGGSRPHAGWDAEQDPGADLASTDGPDAGAADGPDAGAADGPDAGRPGPPQPAWPSGPAGERTAHLPLPPAVPVPTDPDRPPVGGDDPGVLPDIPQDSPADDAGAGEPPPPPDPGRASDEGGQAPSREMGPSTSSPPAVLATLPTPEVRELGIEAGAGSPGSDPDPTARGVTAPTTDGASRFTTTAVGLGDAAVLGVKLVEPAPPGDAADPGSVEPEGERPVGLLAQEPRDDGRTALPIAVLGLLALILAGLRWRAARRQVRTTSRQASRSTKPDAS